MDERRLTAFLIMQGYLSPDQVKEALEEQLRLRRGGADLDVIEVSRRQKFLTDIQVLEVLEKTGYQPPKPTGAATPPPLPQGKKAASDAKHKLPSDAQHAAPQRRAPSDANLSAPSDISAISNVSDLGEVSDPDASGLSASSLDGASERVDAVDAAQDATPLDEQRRGRRGGSSATWNLQRSRRAKGPNSVVAAAVVVPLLFVFLLVLRSLTRSEGEMAGGSPRETARPSVAVNVVKQKLEELQNGIQALDGKPAGAGRDALLARLEQLIKDLRRERMVVSEGRVLERLVDQLARASGKGGAKPPPKLDQTEEANAAWATLASEFEEMLRLCLQQPRSELQLGAELHRGVNLRTQVSEELSKLAQGEGKADAVATLISSPDLHPMLGVGGYTSILAACERFPESLRESDRWQRWSGILARFKQLLRVARAYEEAIRIAEDAAQRGNHDLAKQAFVTSRYASDSWFKAMLGFLDRPEVVKAFAERAKETAGGGPVVRRKVVPTGGGEGTSRRDWGQNWEERFTNLEKAYRRAKDPEQPALLSEFEALLKETESLARGSFSTCEELVEFFAEHQKMFKEGNLREALKRHHEIYFEAAFLRATGPFTLRELDRWCAANGYEAWRARLRGLLRLTSGGGKDRGREKARDQRGEAREAVEKFSDKRLGIVVKGFSELLDWMEKKSFASPAAKAELGAIFTRGVERAGDAVAGARLRDRLERIEHKVEESKEGGLTKAYEKQLENVIKVAVSRSLKAVERAVAAGEPGLAFDLFQYVLQLDPENDRAHKGLGHVKVGERWLRRFDAERLKAGFLWSSDFCWQKVGEEARYQKGDVFDPTTSTWTTLAAANQKHQDPNNPWVITTEHFILRSTADLKVTAQVSERLEAFYLQLFRLYDLFFMDKGGAKLIFGMMDSKPLTVNFYRTQEQFKSHANPPTDWAAGFYSGGRHASFFYASGGWTTLQHEVVHQILGETSPGYGESWLAEGAAVFLEDAFFKNGVLTLGERGNHQRIVAYQARERSSHDEHKLLDMINNYRTSQQWDSGDISKNYRGAGAVVYFLCHFDGGRYRGDFVEYLRAAYNGQRPKLSEFFGISEKTLDALMRRFYDPDAKLELPGAGGGTAEELDAANKALAKVAGSRLVDVDQLALAYGEVQRVLGGVPEKEADKGRKTTIRTLGKMRKRLAKVAEKEIKAAADGKEIAKRRAQLEALRAEALRVIEDPSIYPDANHGAAGQPIVDEKVKALREFWETLPPVFEEPEVKSALAAIEQSDNWMTELEAEEKERGPTKKELDAQLRERVSGERLIVNAEQKKAYDYDQKVRAFNASQSQLAPDGLEQLRILNDYRIMLGRPALAADERLFRCAAKHSAWMEGAGNMSHDEPDPARRTPMLRAKLEGYNDGVGENVAFGYPTALSVHGGWYTSSGHHRNMINKMFWVAGVARSGTYWTQVFGTSKPNL